MSLNPITVLGFFTFVAVILATLSVWHPAFLIVVSASAFVASVLHLAVGELILAIGWFAISAIWFVRFVRWIESRN